METESQHNQRKIIYLVKHPLLGLGAVLIVSVLLFTNISFTPWPEMLLWPYLINRGWLPYQNIAMAHTPLLPLSLSLFYSLFSLSVNSLKYFTFLLFALNTLCIWLISYKTWGKKSAFISVCAYVVLWFIYQGPGLWFDHALALFGLLIFYFTQKKDYFFAGIFASIAFLTKQTAIWFAFPILFSGLLDRQFFAKFFAGVLLISSIALAILSFLGLLGYFIHWAISFGMVYLPQSSGQIQLPSLLKLCKDLWPVTVIAPLIFTPHRRLSLWVVAGVLGVYPRWELFHFQPALPFIAFAFALLIQSSSRLKRGLVLILFAGTITLCLRTLIRTWHQPDRFYSSEKNQIVQFIRSNTLPTDRIYIMNYDDSVYALADRLPGQNPWIPFLPWYLNRPGLQSLTESSLLETKTKFVFKADYLSTGLGSYQPADLENFVNHNYVFQTKVGSVAIMRSRP